MVAFNLFLLGMICAGIGFNFGMAFGWPCWAKVLSAVAVCFMCFFWFVGGLVTGIKQIEHYPTYKVEDGKNQVYIRFKFGPFHYTHTVPQVEED